MRDPLILLATLRKMQVEAKLRAGPLEYTGYQAGLADCVDAVEAWMGVKTLMEVFNPRADHPPATRRAQVARRKKATRRK